MHIAVVTGALGQRSRGNHTTVARWQRTCGVELLPAHADALERVPDLFHGYHAFHGGVDALRLARKYDRPLVISVGGTDLFSFADQVKEVFLRADAVTGAFPGFASILKMRLGKAVPYFVVPRAVELDCVPFHAGPGDVLQVLLPAGLRPVKEPLLAIEMAKQLRAADVPVQLTIAGPALDRAHAAQVRARAEPLEFVTVTEYEPEEMTEVYRRSDVVWNTSVHEGGANALLEAVAHGCAIFARNVTGNRELLSEERAPGTLFDPDDFASVMAFHLAVMRETEDERAQRINRGCDWLRRCHDKDDEATALGRVWHEVLHNK